MLKEKKEKKEELKEQKQKKRHKKKQKHMRQPTREKLIKSQVKNHHTSINKLMKKQKHKLTKKRHR